MQLLDKTDVLPARYLVTSVSRILRCVVTSFSVELEKMAAVVVNADGVAASLDSGSVSPRLPSPSPDQPHQNNALLSLPIVAIDTILNFLSYDEISLLRPVRKQRLQTNSCETLYSPRRGKQK